MSYLLDADWVIDALYDRRGAGDFLTAHFQEGMAIAWVTICELYEGAYASTDPNQEFARLAEIIAPLKLLELDDESARLFGRFRGILRRQGMIISDFDIVLGALSVRHGLTILTHNRKHFERMQGVRIINR